MLEQLKTLASMFNGRYEYRAISQELALLESLSASRELNTTDFGKLRASISLLQPSTQLEIDIQNQMFGLLGGNVKVERVANTETETPAEETHTETPAEEPHTETETPAEEPHTETPAAEEESAEESDEEEAGESDEEDAEEDAEESSADESSEEDSSNRRGKKN